MKYMVSNVYVFYFGGDGIFVEWYAEYNPNKMSAVEPQMTALIKDGI